MRDAGAETLKDLLRNALAMRMAAAIAETQPRGEAQALPTVFLTHVHDGVDLRVRSQSAAQLDDRCVVLPHTALRMSRSQTSSVQNHCLKITLCDTHVFMFCICVHAWHMFSCLANVFMFGRRFHVFIFTFSFSCLQMSSCFWNDGLQSLCIRKLSFQAVALALLIS